MVLTDFDKNLILERVNNIEEMAGNTADIDNVLRFWNINKINLYEIFGQQLRLFRIANLEDSQKKNKKLQEVLIKYNELYQKLYSLYNYDSIIYRLFQQQTLMKNKWEYMDYGLTLKYSGKPLVIRNGSKITRMIKKIAEDAGYGSEVDEFLTAYSMVFNTKTENLKFCLSIHPYDYSTMSDNMCNWNSCMSWDNHGDYRAGTVEMMNSPYVVVAYLCSGKDDYDFDKAWRQLFIVHKDIIVAVKHYPYFSESYTEFCLSWIREVVENSNIGYKYHDEIQYVDTYSTIDTFGKKYECHFYTDDMYNDFNSGHAAYLTDTEYVDINYSGPRHCLCCGSDDYRFFDTPEDLICSRCYEARHCDRCGERLHSNDYTYEVQGAEYCEYCYGEYTGTCACCEEVHDSDELYDVEVHSEGRHTGSYLTICSDCYNESSTDDFGPIRRDTERYWVKIVDLELFTNRGKENYKYYKY